MRYTKNRNEAIETLNTVDVRRGYTRKTAEIAEFLKNENIKEADLRAELQWCMQRVQDSYSETLKNILSDVAHVKIESSEPAGEKLEKEISIALRLELAEKGLKYSRGVIYDAPNVNADILKSLNERFRVVSENNNLYIFKTN